MYLHIGADIVVSMDDLIAIIDLETARKKEATREFMNFTSGGGNTIHISDNGREKSIILTRDKVYYSPISTATLLKRAKFIIAGAPVGSL